jgi:hypothetical protein
MSLKTCGELRLRQARTTSEFSQQREQRLALNKVGGSFPRTTLIRRA